MLPSDSRGKRNWEKSGANRPRTDGPSRMPAKISPTTIGCPMRLKSSPTMRQVMRMMMICKRSRPKDEWMCSAMSARKTLKPSTRFCGAWAESVESETSWCA